ncbi:BspA family leucine-rich repeat surface protein [Euzebyella marina]|uniref:BspA family leucine-rich repeat surface protein n=1 Tax=Euzebyella marina TaxID=1761453 RepID=A0A3G2LAF7_9FLAO|nr:BspA family leucine-rich repeat surface protein [Euzebyella marina]AYN69193.1 BspA family leucine-rich repeat surface protein [Euzebyella marina]
MAKRLFSIVLNSPISSFNRNISLQRALAQHTKKTIKSLLAFMLLFCGLSIQAQSFRSIWNTNNIESGSSANNQITIPTNPAYTIYNYNVDWGDGNTDTGVTGNITHDYTTPGTYTIEISGSFPSIYFNDENASDKLKIIEILAWGSIQWQTMENAFFGCENLNFDAIDSPDLSQVTTLQNMFNGCEAFNGIVNNWDVSTITNISGLFQECTIFNRPLDLWNTANIMDMSYTFHRARTFNEPLDNWNVASVTDMEYFLSEASSFNQNINNWNISNLTNLIGTFRYTGSFNQPLDNWNVSNITDLTGTFQGSAFNRPINNWNVSNVVSMVATFRESQFNQPLNLWDVSNVTNMSQMFHRNRTFDQSINNWNVSNVTDMSEMFDGWIWGAVFNQPLDNWDVSNVVDMEYMFRENSAFNQDISMWIVSGVTNMRGMFEENPAFNQNIDNWNVSNVTNMSSMFNEATAFNQPLNSWVIGNVTEIESMFLGAISFDQPLNNWDMSGKTNLSNMFQNATSFNQDISGWNVSAVTNMSGMFNTASAFNQNLAGWDISAVSQMSNMLSNSGLSQENYDNTLIGWEGQTVQNNVTLGANGLQYCDALNQRQSLIDNDGWTIIGDSVNCSYVLCTDITMPHASDTATPANSDIRWDPAPNATGYRVTLEIERGGIRNYASIDGNTANNYDVGNTVGLDFTNEFQAGDTVYVTVVPYNDEGPATGCQEISFTVVESWVNSPDAFKITIDTRNLDSNSTNANQYRLELNDGYPDYLSYDFNIDWGDGQYNNNVNSDITHTYLNPGVYTIAIIGDFPAFYHSSSNRDNLKLISMDQWGTQVWESMQQTFYFCENMEYNTTDDPILSNVTSMQSMFRRASLFNTDINHWNVSNVTNMNSMFYQAYTYNQPMDSWNVSNVTSMSNMFDSALDFNQNINNWDVSSVTNMSGMFGNTDNFDQPLNNWDVGNVTSMRQMFVRSEVFDQPIGSWNVSSVLDMHEMFYSAEAFNQDIDSWDVSSVTQMSGMFHNAAAFNQPLNSWDVASVTTMQSMFNNANAFNQPIDNWNVAQVNNMNSMFNSADAFDRNINSWNVTNVTDMASMFNYAQAFNQPLNSWDVNSVVNLSRMFRGAVSFDQPLNNWDVSAVANMSNMFEEAIIFNQSLNTWDTSSVTLMPSMFEDAALYDQEMNDWDVAVVTNFDSMFQNAEAFNRPLNNWNTGEAQNMAEMFYGATLFDQDIDNWNTSFVTTMFQMFREAAAFNRSLDSWNVASVTTMQGMFQNATSFNSSINNWNVRAVSTMQDMFRSATSYNQSLNNWRVTNVGNMDRMFNGATALDQSFDQWLIGTVSMRDMFHDATAFNQYLGDWNVSNVTNMQGMLDDSALSRENYDNTLIAWSEQTLTPGITLGANALPYCDAVEERQAMIDSFGWTFSGDVLDCPIPECTQLAAPLNGDVDVPVNTNITWDPSLYAREYRLTVGTTPGGNDIVNNETIVNETFYEFSSDFTGGETVYVTLIPSNENGDAVGPCTEESFTVTTTPATVPDCTTMNLPVNGATDVAVDTDISWNIISNADGYRLNVGTTTGGTDIVNNEDLGNVTEYEFITDLPENVEIFVTIVPYNDQGDASGCGEESFITEFIPVPPLCTSLSSPANGAVNVAIDTDLSWNTVADATGYLVSVGTTAGGIEVVNNIDVGNVTTYSFDYDLQDNRTYYVRIIPYNAIGDASGCSEEEFTTGTGTLSDPPNCTTLSDPINGANDVPVGADISWNAVANTDGYYLTIGTSSGGTDILNAEDVGNVTMYDLATDLPEATQLFITVVPYNAIGNATGCTEESFTTETLPAAPNCTILNSPSNNAVDVSVSTQLSWDAVSDADGYYLTVGTISGGNDILNAEDTGNVNSYDLADDLPESTEIFVTIVPYNTVGNATGCIEESFTTEALPTAPVCTQLSNPLNGATEVSISTHLNWNSVSNADGYYVTVGTISGGSDILDGEDVASTSFDLATDLPENTQIFVTIVPYNGVGVAVGCTEESFTTEVMGAAPNCTALTSPTNGEANVSISTNLIWASVNNADSYYINVGTSTGGTDILNNELASTNTIALSNNLPEGTEIFVTIVPFNGRGNALGCIEESFTTETFETVPDCTSIIVPENDQFNVHVDTEFVWNSISNADGYYLSLGSSAGSHDILDSEDVGILTSYTPAQPLPYDRDIFVSIVAYNAQGSAIGCTESSFTTQEEPEEEKLETLYGFSPNGDFINDVWSINGIEAYPENTVSIFNRWGDLVFFISGYDNNANVFKGEANQKTKIGAGELPAGTYFFKITLPENHNLKATQGFVVIKR